MSSHPPAANQRPGPDVAADLRVVRDFLRRKLGGPVEDACQETLVRSLVAHPRFAQRSSFRAFLLGIAWNVAREQYRAGRHPAARWRDGLDALCDPTDAADLVLVRDQELSLLRAALSRLPEAHRHVLHEYYWERSTAAAIGERLGIPENTVRSRIRRALALLAAAMGPDMVRPRGACGAAHDAAVGVA